VRRRSPHPLAPGLIRRVSPDTFSRVGRRETPLVRRALRERVGARVSPHPGAIHPGFALTLSFLRPKIEKKEIHWKRDGGK
jgi:hypothetical protein